MVHKEINKLFSSKVIYLNNGEKDRINVYFCNRKTKNYGKEETKLEYVKQNQVTSPR